MSHVIRYGSPNQELVDQATDNFTDASFSERSFCTTPVELLSLDGEESVVSHATGFFWHNNGIDFVVTNWHVISGRNIFTRDLLSSKAFIPRRIRVHGWRMSTPEQGKIEQIRSSLIIDMGEYGQELFSTPPLIGGRPVDIAAIPLPPGFVMDRTKLEIGNKFHGIVPIVNLMPNDNISTQAGDECVLLGYPLAQYSGLMLPIWKRGSIATDTNMAVDDSPAFIIDAATSSAMSGSPVFRRISGNIMLDKTSQVISELRGFEFLGVYAGRLQSGELSQINMGYVWFGNQVDAAVNISWDRWVRLGEKLRQESNAKF